MTRYRWLGALVIWQLAGLLIGLGGSVAQKDLHGFIAFLNLCLTFINSSALIASALWLIYLRWIGPRVTRRYLTGAAAAGIVLIAAYAGANIAFATMSRVFGIAGQTVNSNHIYLLCANLIAGLLIAGLSFTAYMYERQKNTLQHHLQETENQRRLQIESRLEVLQSKFNPHFLFNAFNTMLERIYQKPHEVESIILNLSGIYRKILTLPDHGVVTLAAELKLVREYLEIEKIRLGERLDFKISADDRLANLQIPSLIILMTAENAVEHGINLKRQGGQLYIVVHKEGPEVLIHVKDNGAGMNRAKESSGFSIDDVRQRLKSLYQAQAQVSVTRLAEGGTKISMTIPYRMAGSEAPAENPPTSGERP